MEKLLKELGMRFFTDEEFRNEVMAGNGKINKKAKLLFLMVRDYADGEYTRVPKTAVILAAGLAAYYVLGKKIPGHYDEMAVLGLVLAAIGTDIDEYRIWREQRDTSDMEVRVTINGVKVHLNSDQVSAFVKDNLKEAVYAELSTE